MSRSSLFNCLIRTHHIASRKKLQKVRRAASQANVNVLYRYGAPGLMYGESYDEAGLADWVASVQALRYKDFRCVYKPSPMAVEQSQCDEAAQPISPTTGFHEAISIADFAQEMEKRNLTTWWKRGMGYEK